MSDTVYFKIKNDAQAPDEAVDFSLPRADEDGAGIMISLYPEGDAGIVIEVFDDTLLLHLWDGIRSRMA